MIAESPAMQPVLQLIARVGPSDANVLITGEPGPAKKSSLARCTLSQARVDSPWSRSMPVASRKACSKANCSATCKGAFTDAKTDRVGRFELADGGTLFLDEIANVPMNLQAKLLRVLETGEMERVGSSKTSGGRARDLGDQREARGRSRRRTFSRRPAVPPEHDRDPPAAAARTARGHSAAGLAFPRRRTRGGIARSCSGFDPAAMQALLDNPWQGNVRELNHVGRARRADGPG